MNVLGGDDGIVIMTLNEAIIFAEGVHLRQHLTKSERTALGWLIDLAKRVESGELHEDEDDE